MKKILFLDFDGVLVTDRCQTQQWNTNGVVRDSHGALFDPECVKFLKEIIDITDADIVVTSTWKMEMGLEGVLRMWRDRGLPGKIIGTTPGIDPIHRGDEIAAWLTSFGEDCRFAIIDDTPFTDFFREEQLPHLFKVDERIGIDEETARRVIDYFNGNLSKELCNALMEVKQSMEGKKKLKNWEELVNQLDDFKN
ncbi:MAG: HAD domain-containing protein [Prevotella sp.]